MDKMWTKHCTKEHLKISRDNYILDLGTIMNPDLVISTVAKDEETGTHYSNADESVNGDRYGYLYRP